MSLIKLIQNLSSSEKTRLLGEETTRILRYTFTTSDTEAVPTSIIDLAVASKDGINLVYKKKLRRELIDSLSSQDIASLGFESYDVAITKYERDIDAFIKDFKIESEYKLEKIEDERESLETSMPIYGQCNGTNAFPHDYQLRLKDQISFQILNDQNRAVLVTMPTGAGKTVLAMEVLIDLFRTYRADSDNILKIGWFVDSKELCEQSFQSFQKLWKQKGDREIVAERFYDKFNVLDLRNVDKITFGAFTLLAERVKSNEVQQFLKDLDLVVIDEAHGSKAYTYNQVIADYFRLNHQGRLLGLTATPFRSDDSDHETLKGMFHSYLEITDRAGKKLDSPMEYLIDKGYLAKLQFQVLNSERGNSNSEYYQQLHDSVQRECHKLINKKENCIIFAQSKSHAIALHLFLNYNQIENELIVGETPASKRKDYLKRFGDKDDSLSILVNYHILSTGIDVPGMNAIMILANIDSPTLALQIIGRAMRGEKNGGNPVNTIYLTKDNHNKLGEYKLLENIVLQN